MANCNAEGNEPYCSTAFGHQFLQVASSRQEPVRLGIPAAGSKLLGCYNVPIG
jgi:hypothetical protein